MKQEGSKSFKLKQLVFFEDRLGQIMRIMSPIATRGYNTKPQAAIVEFFDNGDEMYCTFNELTPATDNGLRMLYEDN
jgi:hypothetical protein